MEPNETIKPDQFGLTDPSPELSLAIARLGNLPVFHGAVVLDMGNGVAMAMRLNLN